MSTTTTTIGPSTPAPLTPVERLGQDFAKVYSSGELIIRQPIEASTVYLITVILASAIEFLFEMSGRVNSKFFHDLLQVQMEEVLVFGTLILLLVFISSMIADMPENWAVVFTWCEMAIVFMALFFVGLTSGLAGLTAKMIRELDNFETTRMGGGGDGKEKITAQERLFTFATTRFKMSMLAYGYDKPLVFAKYLFRIQKALICRLGDLNWKVWLSMALPSLFNAVRGASMDGAESSGNASIALFIMWQGGLPLLLFGFVYRKLRNGLEEYLEKDHEALAFRVKSLDANFADAMDGDVLPFTKEELTDPKQYLIWSSLENTINVVQICLIQITWYGSILVVTMFSKIFNQNGGISFVMFCGSLLPFVAFISLMPWGLTVIAILSCLERELNEPAVAASYERLEKDGLAKLLVVKNQAAEDEKKKQEFSVNNTAAIQAAIDAKLADEAAKARKDALVDEFGRPLAKKLPSRPLTMDDNAVMRMHVTRMKALQEQEDD